MYSVIHIQGKAMINTFVTTLDSSDDNDQTNYNQNHNSDANSNADIAIHITGLRCWRKIYNMQDNMSYRCTSYNHRGIFITVTVKHLTDDKHNVYYSPTNCIEPPNNGHFGWTSLVPSLPFPNTHNYFFCYNLKQGDWSRG